MDKVRVRYIRSMKTVTVQVRLDKELKTGAEEVLSKLGLTSAEAIRIFYGQIVLHGGLPFRVELPNKTTAETLKKSHRGEDIETHSSPGEMFKNW